MAIEVVQAMRHNVINKFNRGEVDSKALVRDDYEKLKDSCEHLENWFPVRLGAMQYRQGTQYLGATAAEAYFVPFIAAADDVALIEHSNSLIRIWVDDAVVTRTAVTTTIANGEFTSDVTSWTTNDGAGSVSSWDAGTLSLVGTNTTSASKYQTLTTETGKEHGLRIIILEAPVLLKIGTTGADSTEITETTLAPGTHSLAFTPASNITITFSNSTLYAAKVDSVAIEAAGAMTLPTEVTAIASLRSTQSADVTYTTSSTSPWFKIERRGVKSWSVVDGRADDGAFNTINISDIGMTAGALNGNTTLTASSSHFVSGMVGQLYKLASAGQTVSASVSAQDTGTNSIQVFGTGTGRNFTVNITGTWAGTVTLQRSADDVTWEDTSSTWTANVSVVQNDADDNAVYYYRLYVKTGDYTSGTAELELIYSAGSIEGICRVTEVTSTTVAQVQVLKDFGSTDITRNWYPGSWSDATGNPTSVALYEGRLWLAGKDNLWGSVSDVYSSFDRDVVGDSSSIKRVIGFGAVETVNWLAPSTRLLMGLATSEISVRSTAFGEPLTPSNTNLKAASTRGAANIEPLQIDDEVYFVQRSGKKIYEAAYNVDRDAHVVSDIMKLHQEICSAGIKRIAVSREPETRVWVVLEDGDARCYLVDFSEEVSAWSRVTMDGDIEDVVVLPDDEEDRVYFVVNRTGGRYLEKLALFTEARGGTISKHSDSFLQQTSPGTTISVAHLDGKTVSVWADGQDRGTYTVSSGTITVPSSWTNVTVGLPHIADYTSNKVSRYVPWSVTNVRKRIVDAGLVLENYWPGGLTIGASVALLEDLPDFEEGSQVSQTTTMTTYDYLPFEFNGEEESDPRIYMRATAPCTILSLSYGVKQSGDTGEQQ